MLIVSQFCAAQQWKTIVKEDFGSQTSPHRRSQTPAQDLLPGTTSYNPLIDNNSFAFNDGNYMIASSSMAPRTGLPGNVSGVFISGVLDHTVDDPIGSYGNMFVINANPTRQGEQNGTYYKYETSLFDVPGAQYRIRFYGANILLYGLSTQYKNGHVGLAIRHTGSTPTPIAVVNTWVLPRTTNSSNTTLPWQENTTSFTLPIDYVGNSLTFNFFNSDTDSSTEGNDLVIDDILIEMRVVSLSGKVFIDKNANGLQDVGDLSVNGVSTPVYVYILSTDNKVMSKTQVANDGTYSFSGDNGVPYSPANLGMKVIVSSQNLSVNDVLVSSVINDKVVVSENVSQSNGVANLATGAVNGVVAINRSDNDFTNVNFGIRALCYRPAATSGQVLETNHGITSLGRAGFSATEWPKARKGAHTVLEAKTKGLVLNRLSTVEIQSIPASNLIDGMLVFDTDLKCLKLYVQDSLQPTNTGWHCLEEQTCPE